MSKDRSQPKAQREAFQQSQQFFITVLYGEDREELFNPHCKCFILLECMRVKSECEKEVKLDLMDDKGQLKNVFTEQHLDEYASNVLQERKKYFLIKVVSQSEKGGAPGDVKYEALLRTMNRRFPHLAERLRNLSLQFKRSKLAKHLKSKSPVNKLSKQLPVKKTKSPTKNVSDSFHKN